MKLGKDGYYTNRHSCFLLQYHLVIVTKYRRPVITGRLKDELIVYTKDYFKKQNCALLEINTDKDHIHILFEAPPQINLANFVNAYKSASSRRIRTDFADALAPVYWKPYFWSQSYFVATVSDRSKDAVAKYIINQGRQEESAFTPV